MRSTRIPLSWCVLIAAVITTSIVSDRSSAQQPLAGRGGQRQQQASTPIAITYTTFKRAARIMESALPVYDGQRHRAIELAKLSAREIKLAAEGAPATTGGTIGTASGNNTQRKTAAQQAEAIPKGANVNLSRYTAAQISASNTKMQQGMQLLQQGLQRIQAIGNDPGNHMNDALEFGNYAIQAANKGLAFVASKQ